MDISVAEGLMFSLSPILILLFAYEMSATEWLYHKGRITESSMSVRVALSVLKLPISIVLPFVCGLCNELLGNIALVVVIAVNIAAVGYVFEVALKHDIELKK